MKLFLASYFEPENHGNGRKIGISINKPNEEGPRACSTCQVCFDPFIPDSNAFWTYHDTKKTDPLAGKKFSEAYKSQLENFLTEIEGPEDLPFEEGDTLLSWEKRGHLSYRSILATYLEKLGYEVEQR